MYSTLLFGHNQARIHRAAASPLTKQKQEEVPDEQKRVATSRCSKAVVLLAASGLVCFADGALAQIKETIPPTLSSGLREASSARTPGAERPSNHAPIQSLFDAGSLPPIASIGAGSDIRPYLAPGMPEDLTRAALRRAWSTDPAIRDFIGLSENPWDFNTPDAVSGFGPLITDETGRLSARPAEDPKTRNPSASRQSTARLNKSGK
jgi:hypothetical protein